MRDRLRWCLAVGMLACLSGKVRAQDEFDYRWNSRSGNWTVDENWLDSTGQTAFPPDASFEEGAFIGNGGTAIVDSAVVDIFNLAVPNGTIDLQPGGSLKVVGSGEFAREVSIGSSGGLAFAGDASLETSLGLNSVGTIGLHSAAATFNVGGDLNSRGTLHLDITGAGTPKITGGGNARLGGSIVANFSGVAPAFGDTYTFLTGASSVTNSGTKVVLPDTVSLARGLDVQVVNDNNSASLTVGNLPVLTVHRATGATSIANVVGGPLTMTGYSVGSALGLLNPARLSGLAAQGATGWIAPNPLENTISELNLTGEQTLEVDDSISLGNVYNGGPTHPRDEDVTFEFSTPDGRVLAGLVEYTGPANDLVLNANPETGEVTIQNLSAFIDPIDVTGYNITSTSGSLVGDNWTSFSDSGLAGDGWTETPTFATSIAELNLSNAKTFSNGTVISLGNIFDVNGVRDLVLEYATSDELLFATVEYGFVDTVVPIPGDCNGDGAVNAADLECVSTIADRDIVLASIPTLAGDLDGNGAVAFPDFLTLSNNFGRSDGVNYTDGDVDVNGTIAFPDFLTLSNNFGKTPGAAAAAVPEPGSLTLLGLAGVVLAARRRRRESRS